MKIIRKLKKISSQGRFFSTIKSVIKPYVYGSFHLFYNPAKKMKIHCPPCKDPDTNDPIENEIVNRIFQSFTKMKKDQQSVNKTFQPASL